MCAGEGLGSLSSMHRLWGMRLGAVRIIKGASGVFGASTGSGYLKVLQLYIGYLVCRSVCVVYVEPCVHRHSQPLDDRRRQVTAQTQSGSRVIWVPECTRDVVRTRVCVVERGARESGPLGNAESLQSARRDG